MTDKFQSVIDLMNYRENLDEVQRMLKTYFEQLQRMENFDESDIFNQKTVHSMIDNLDYYKAKYEDFRKTINSITIEYCNKKIAENELANSKLNSRSKCLAPYNRRIRYYQDLIPLKHKYEHLPSIIEFEENLNLLMKYFRKDKKK